MKNFLEIINESQDLILHLCYNMYKQNWISERPYLYHKTEEELELGGEIYVCFDEFCDCEFEECKEEYIKDLATYINNVMEV